MKIIIYLFLIFLCPYAFGQSFHSDTLYLRLDKSKLREHTTEWITTGSTQQKIVYYDYFPLIHGTDFEFICENRFDVVIVSQSSLVNYPVRTLEQLEAYFNTLTQEQVLQYLESRKRRYYIVEILPNGTAEIIPVKLDMQID